MPRVAFGKRRRAYRPKTRTGCLTCKYVEVQPVFFYLASRGVSFRVPYIVSWTVALVIWCWQWGRSKFLTLTATLWTTHIPSHNSQTREMWRKKAPLWEMRYHWPQMRWLWTGAQQRGSYFQIDLLYSNKITLPRNPWQRQGVSIIPLLSHEDCTSTICLLWGTILEPTCSSGQSLWTINKTCYHCIGIFAWTIWKWRGVFNQIQYGSEVQRQLRPSRVRPSHSSSRPAILPKRTTSNRRVPDFVYSFRLFRGEFL